jgi:AAHS family 4-hydroxybenzoate transporter-like MFS transporter
MTEDRGTMPPAPRSLQQLIDAAPLSGLQIRAVLLCTLVTFAEGIDLNLIPLLAPRIAAEWSLPAAAFGVIFSAGPIGLILGGLGIGWLADRIGRRGALIAAMLAMAAPTALTGWTTSVAELGLCRLVTGIGFGGVVPAAAALVSEFLPTRLRASVVAFVILGQSAGGLVAALLMRTPIGALGWQTLVVAMAGLCVLITLILHVALPESPRYLLLNPGRGQRLAHTLASLGLTEAPAPEPVGASGAGSLAALFTEGRGRGTALLWGTFIGVCATVGFFTSWLTLIYTYGGHSPAAGADLSAAYWAGGIVSGVVLPLFALRWPVERVLMASILAAALSSLALGGVFAGGTMANLALAFTCGVFVSGAFYLLYPPAVRFYPTAIRASGIGAAVAFGRIGNTLSPMAASLLLAAGVAPAGVVRLMALPLLLSACMLAAFCRIVRPPAPTGQA